MASNRPSYFLSPSWDLSPEEVGLGSIVGNFKTPQRQILAVDETTDLDTPVHVQKQSLASGAATNFKERSIGLFSKFLQNILVGGELSVSQSSSTELEYSCVAMETRRFTPSPAYVSKVAKDAAVQDWLKIGGFRTRVFIITGVKIASGITITTTKARQHETKMQVGVEIPVPELTVGPQACFKSETTNKHWINVEGPIVFAVQVEKLCISMRGKVTTKEFIIGSMLGNKQGGDEVPIELALDDFEEDGMDDFEVAFIDGIDEITGEECQVIFDCEE